MPSKKIVLTPRQQAEEYAASRIGVALLRLYRRAMQEPSEWKRKEAVRDFRKAGAAAELTMGLMEMDLGGWA